MVTAKFNRTKSYFPTEGKLTDKFNGNFRLVVDVTGAEITIPKESFGIGILWKGKAYIVAVNGEAFNSPAELAMTWGEKQPTVADFLKAVGEELPKETTTYSYAWFTGFFVDESNRVAPRQKSVSFAVTDKWNTELLVTVPPFPWDKVLMAAGLGTVLLGVLVIASRRPEYVRRVPEYARRGVEYVRERIPATV